MVAEGQLSLGVLLRLGHQRFSNAVEVVLAQSGFDDLRPHHANVFTFVPDEGMQVSDLAILAGVRKQTLTQVIEELEKLGYVERRPHPTDRRARLVFLTPRGKSVRPLAMEAGRRVENSLSEAFGQSELDRLRRDLQHMLVLLEGEPRARARS
jgi:DNA-binding MarR family transcriptional regulator